MKFSALSKAFNDDAIEQGAWLHLVGPDGEPMYLKPHPTDPKKSEHPVRFKVRSTLSTTYEQHLDAVQKRAASQARKLKGERQRQAMLEELKKERPKSFAALVSEVQNIDESQPGKGGSPTYDELFAFASESQNKFWVDQALEHATDPANYGGEAAPAVVEGNADGEAG